MQAEQQSERKPLSDEQVRVIYKEWLNAPGHANEFDLIQMAARAALSHPSTPQGWISVNDALPPEREMVAVGWMDVEDHDHADRYSIDYLDDGVWQFYFSEHEHYLIAGVAKGRSEDAPYTHWQRIGAIPAPPEQGSKHADKA